jgi:hypothetical protein
LIDTQRSGIFPRNDTGGSDQVIDEGHFSKVTMRAQSAQAFFGLLAAILNNLHLAADDNKQTSILLALADDFFPFCVGALAAQSGDPFQIPILQMGEK